MKYTKEIARLNTTSGVTPIQVRVTLNHDTNALTLFGYAGVFSLKCDYKKNEVLIDRFTEALLLLADCDEDEELFEQIRTFLLDN